MEKKKQKNNVVYISGKISDRSKQRVAENLKKFFDKEVELKTMWKKVINPASFQRENDDYKYEEYLADDIVIIEDERPDLYMLDGWESSSGARIERQLAKRRGLNIYYEIPYENIKK